MSQAVDISQTTQALQREQTAFPRFELSSSLNKIPRQCLYVVQHNISSEDLNPS